MPPKRPADDSPIHLTAQQAKSLSYQTQAVPSFLKALHSQVNGPRNYKDQGEGRGGDGDELDDLVGCGSGGIRRGDSFQEEEDEFEGAQIVVLKDGKHLSREEALREKRNNPGNKSLPSDLDTSSSISQPGIAPTSKKRSAITVQETEDEKAAQLIFDSMTSKSFSTNPNSNSDASTSAGGSKNGMDEAKTLIANEKKRKLEKQQEKEREKEAKLKEKNKKARKEKSKSGKGLSFNLED